MFSPLSRSQNEDNLVRALVFMQYPYVQQYLIGTNGVRGSQYVDIVVYLPPRPTALFVEGLYWHNAQTQVEDQLKQDQAKQRGWRVIVVPDHDDETYQAALAFVKANLP